MAPGGLMGGLRRVLKGSSKRDKSPASTPSKPGTADDDGLSSRASAADSLSTLSDTGKRASRKAPSGHSPSKMVAAATSPVTHRSRSSTPGQQAAAALLDPRAQQAAQRHAAARKDWEHQSPAAAAPTPSGREGERAMPGSHKQSPTSRWATAGQSGRVDTHAESDSDTSLEFPEQVIEEGPPPSNGNAHSSDEYVMPDTGAAAVVAHRGLTHNPLFGGAQDMAEPPLSYELSSPVSSNSFAVSEEPRAGQFSAGMRTAMAARSLQIPGDDSETSPSVITPAVREARTVARSDSWRTSPSQSRGSASSGRVSHAAAAAAPSPAVQDAANGSIHQSLPSQEAAAGFSGRESEQEERERDLFPARHWAGEHQRRAMTQTPSDASARWRADAEFGRPSQRRSPGDRLPAQLSGSPRYSQPPVAADSYAAANGYRQRLVQTQPFPSGWQQQWEAGAWQQPSRRHESHLHESSAWPPPPPHLHYPSRVYEPWNWEGPYPGRHWSEREYREAYYGRPPHYQPDQPQPSTSGPHRHWGAPDEDLRWRPGPYYAAESSAAPRHRQRAVDDWHGRLRDMSWRPPHVERDLHAEEPGSRPDWAPPTASGSHPHLESENVPPNSGANVADGRSHRRGASQRKAVDAETANVKEEVTELRRVAAFLQSKLAGVEQELRATREQQENARSSYSAAEGEAAELRGQLAAAQAAEGELAAVVDELKEGLERAVTQKDAELGRLRESLAAAQAEADHQEELADLAQGELDEFKRRLAAEVEHARQEALQKAALEARDTNVLARQLQQAKADLQKSVEEGEALHEMLTANHQKRAELEERTEDLEAELELCKGSMARLERQLASSEAGKAAAEARLEELAAQVEQLATYPSPASTVPSISRLQKRATAQAADGKLLNGDVAYSAGSFEGLMDSIDLESLDLQRPSWPAEDTKQAAGLEQELTGAKAELKRLADVEALAVDALQALEAQTREAIRLRAHAAELEEGLQQRDARLQEALQRQAVLEEAIADRDSKLPQPAATASDSAPPMLQLTSRSNTGPLASSSDSIVEVKSPLAAAQNPRLLEEDPHMPPPANFESPCRQPAPLILQRGLPMQSPQPSPKRGFPKGLCCVVASKAGCSDGAGRSQPS